MRIGPMPVIAVLTSVAVLYAGCSDELADFREDELRPLEQEAKRQKALLAATLKTVEVGDRADARRLSAPLTALQRINAELAELDPPDDYEENYARFVAANDSFTVRMRDFVAALRRGDRAAMRMSSEKAKEAIGAAQNAIAPVYE